MTGPLPPPLLIARPLKKIFFCGFPKLGITLRRPEAGTGARAHNHKSGQKTGLSSSKLKNKLEEEKKLENDKEKNCDVKAYNYM